MSSLDIEELIALVRKKPQLWDRGNKFHSNRRILDKCWSEIAIELKADENKIRKKWKYLRDQFSVEFGKIPPSGCEDEVLNYEPKWRYYKPLQFLEEVVTPRVNTKNPRREDDSSEDRDTSAPGSPSAVDNGAKLARYSQRMDTKKHKRYRDKQKKRRHSDAVNEEHMHFFKSLLPHVRNIPHHLQLSFRNRVQEAVEEFAYRSEGAAASNADKTGFPPTEPYFITCLPYPETKFEPLETVDVARGNEDDGDSS